MPAAVTFPPRRDHREVRNYRRLRKKRFLAANTTSAPDDEDNHHDTTAAQIKSSNSSVSSSSSASPQASMPPNEDTEEDCAFERLDTSNGKKRFSSEDGINNDLWQDLALSLLPQDYLQAWTECSGHQEKDGGGDHPHICDDDATAFDSLASKTDFAGFWKNLPTIMKIENKVIEREHEEEKKALPDPRNLVIRCPSDVPNKATATGPANKTMLHDITKETNLQTDTKEDEKSAHSGMVPDDFSLTDNISVTRSYRSFDSLHSFRHLPADDASSLGTQSVTRSRSLGNIDEKSVDSLLSFYRMHQNDFSSVGSRSVASRSIARSTARTTARSTARSVAKSVKSMDTLRRFYKMLEEDDGSTTIGRSVARSTARSIGRSTVADDETSLGSFVSALTTDDLSVDFDNAFVPLRSYHASFFPTIPEYPSDEEKSDDDVDDEEETLCVNTVRDEEDDCSKSEPILDENFCNVDSFLETWGLPKSEALLAGATAQSCDFCSSASCLHPAPPPDLLPEPLIPSEDAFERVRSFM